MQHFEDGEQRKVSKKGDPGGLFERVVDASEPLQRVAPEAVAEALGAEEVIDEWLPIDDERQSAVDPVEPEEADEVASEEAAEVDAAISAQAPTGDWVVAENHEWLGGKDERQADGQAPLFESEPEWVDHWKGMPEFEQKDLSPWRSMTVHFRNQHDRDAFAKLVGQPLSDLTRSIWFPKAEIGRLADKRYVDGKDRK